MCAAGVLNLWTTRRTPDRVHMCVECAPARACHRTGSVSPYCSANTARQLRVVPSSGGQRLLQRRCWLHSGVWRVHVGACAQGYTLWQAAVLVQAVCILSENIDCASIQIAVCRPGLIAVWFIVQAASTVINVGLSGSASGASRHCCTCAGVVVPAGPHRGVGHALALVSGSGGGLFSSLFVPTELFRLVCSRY